MTIAKLRLGVNIDHVATLRNARGGALPDPLRAAQMALAAGADGITAHLREDRRHIRDEDMARLKQNIDAPLNFEMAATEQMLDIALKTKPHACCLVPEKRTERTTEGGLDVIGGRDHLVPFVDELLRAEIRVSLFIEPSIEAIQASASVRSPVVELHTGAWAHALEEGERTKPRSNSSACGLARTRRHGSGSNATRAMASISPWRGSSRHCPQVVELNIGHFLIGEAVFIGLDAAMQTDARGDGRGTPECRRGGGAAP